MGLLWWRKSSQMALAPDTQPAPQAVSTYVQAANSHLVDWSDTAANAQEALPGRKSSIRYDSDLIDQLTREHKELLSSFTAMLNACKASDWGSVFPLMDGFRKALNGHLLKEGVKLYAYMSANLSNDPDLALIFRSYKSEMSQIGRVVFSLFDEYKTAASLREEPARKRFLEKLNEIAPVLIDRIQREESQLYPLYTAIR